MMEMINRSCIIDQVGSVAHFSCNCINSQLAVSTQTPQITVWNSIRSPLHGLHAWNAVGTTWSRLLSTEKGWEVGMMTTYS